MENKITEPGTIGIDAGGTFTDLVFLGGQSRKVLAKEKVPTDHRELLRTIEAGLDLLLRKVETEAVRSVNLATTLVTNAIVERRMRPSALVLIGYPTDLADQVERAVGGEVPWVLRIDGGHTSRGDEQMPLDTETLEKVLRALDPAIWSIAISGYFSVRNVDHELRAAEVVRRICPNAVVTCGHDLASSLDAVKRASTAALNAGLIPIVMDLLQAARQVLEIRRIQVPLTIVRGDGSLVGEAWAIRHPVEMILSGPAASGCGARFLARADQAGRCTWVADMGGTTTDIIRLDASGRPALNEEGATVGGYQTLIRAIDIDTFGLGGDSRICYRSGHQLLMGPRRVQPLCVTASEYPELLAELRTLLEEGACGEPLVLLLDGGGDFEGPEKALLEKLRDGPHLAQTLLRGTSSAVVGRMLVEELERAGAIRFSGFTPTDALHLSGRLDKWNGEASRLGAALLRAQYGETEEALLTEISRAVTERMGLALLKKSFASVCPNLTEKSEGGKLLLAALDHAAFGREGGVVGLNAMLVGVGAPAWAFVPQVGNCLGERAVLPEHGEVAGAVGAASGTFFLEYTVRIVPNEDGTCRTHGPFGVRDYELLEEAVEKTDRALIPWLLERARAAGVTAPQVECRRRDEEAWIRGGSQKLYLWTELSYHVLEADPLAPVAG